MPEDCPDRLEIDRLIQKHDGTEELGNNLLAFHDSIAKTGAAKTADILIP